MAKKKSASKKSSNTAVMDRRSKDRRSKDRRTKSTPVAVERRQGERRKVPRRRQIDPTTCERDYTDAEVEFMRALEDYKRRSGRMFPTCSEILEVLRDLGYEKKTADEANPPTEAEATGDAETPAANDEATSEPPTEP